MSDYQPRLDDIQFILNQVLHAPERLAELPVFQEVDADLMAQVLEEAGKFVTAEIAPLNRVGDEVGAEVVEVTPANFRQILSRARKDLYEYLRGNCGLMGPANSCKCARKTRAYIGGGFVDPQNLKFTKDYQRRVRDVADARAEEWSEAYMQHAASLYRDHPFYEPAEQAAIVRLMLESVSLEPE